MANVPVIFRDQRPKQVLKSEKNVRKKAYNKHIITIVT